MPMPAATRLSSSVVVECALLPRLDERLPGVWCSGATMSMHSMTMAPVRMSVEMSVCVRGGMFVEVEVGSCGCVWWNGGVSFDGVGECLGRCPSVNCVPCVRLGVEDVLLPAPEDGLELGGRDGFWNGSRASHADSSPSGDAVDDEDCELRSTSMER